MDASLFVLIPQLSQYERKMVSLKLFRAQFILMCTAFLWTFLAAYILHSFTVHLIIVITFATVEF